MSKETNEILGHGDEADGIEEYDNPLPDWWLGLFFLTVVYGVGYAVNYHFIADDSQEKRYLAEMAAAEERWPTPEAPAELVVDAQAVAAGAEIYAQNCAACHKADMTGGIGPSLVDAEWIHGNKPEEIVSTIETGVASKGMPAWGPILGPTKVHAVAAFVVSKTNAGDGGGASDTPGEETDGAKPTPEKGESAEGTDAAAPI